MRTAVIRLALVGGAGILGAALQWFLDAQDEFDVAAVVPAVGDIRVAPVIGAVAIVLLYVDSLDEPPWRQLDLVRGRFPGAARMILARIDHPAGIEQIFREGITGLVDVRTNPTDFFEAVRRAARKEPVLLLASDTRELAVTPSPAGVTSLTPRERQILEFVCGGLTSKQIASVLGVSVRTVSAHLQDAYRRLGVTNRLSAVEQARREGFLS